MKTGYVGDQRAFQERILHMEKTRLAQVRTAVRADLIGGPPFLSFGGSSLFQNSPGETPFTGFTGTGKRQPHAGPHGSPAHHIRALAPISRSAGPPEARRVKHWDSGETGGCGQEILDEGMTTVHEIFLSAEELYQKLGIPT